jgi:hypothetical protein
MTRIASQLTRRVPDSRYGAGTVVTAHSRTTTEISAPRRHRRAARVRHTAAVKRHTTVNMTHRRLRGVTLRAQRASITQMLVVCVRHRARKVARTAVSGTRAAPRRRRHRIAQPVVVTLGRRTRTEVRVTDRSTSGVSGKGADEGHALVDMS